MDSCWIIHLPGFLNSGNIPNRNVDVFGGFVTNNYLQWLPTLILYYDQSMIMTAADYKYSSSPSFRTVRVIPLQLAFKSHSAG